MATNTIALSQTYPQRGPFMPLANAYRPHYLVDNALILITWYEKAEGLTPQHYSSHS